MNSWCNDTVLIINVPQMSLVRTSRKSTVETTLKQLEYITKGHAAMQTIYCLKFKMALFFSSF